MTTVPAFQRRRKRSVIQDDADALLQSVEDAARSPEPYTITVPSLAAALQDAPALRFLATDPKLGPAFEVVCTAAGPKAALYCAYVIMGYPELDAYRLVQHTDTERIPPAWKQRHAPWVSYAVAAVMPHRLWAFSKFREIVDDPATPVDLRASMVRWMMDKQIAAVEAENANPVNGTFESNPALTEGIRQAISTAILARGASLLIPPDPQTTPALPSPGVIDATPEE